MGSNQVAHLSREGALDGYPGADEETVLGQKIGPTFFYSVPEEGKTGGGKTPKLDGRRGVHVNGIDSHQFWNAMSGQTKISAFSLRVIDLYSTQQQTCER